MPPIELIEKRTRNSKTHSLGGHKFSWDGTIGSIHYEDNGWQEIDNIFEPAVAPWDWQMLKAGYHIRVKEDFTAGQIIEFEKQGETVQFQPMALEWTNDLDQIQQISMPHEVVPVITNPEVDLLPAVGMPSRQGTIRWNDAYGEGIDFEWQCTSTRLIKTLEIENLNKLIAPEQYILDGGNPVLRLNLIFDPSSDVNIYVDGQVWNQSSKAQTFNIVEFHKDGEVLWGFMPLRYWDSSEDNEGQSIATLEKRGNKFYVSIRVSYSWLQSASYPVFIDINVDETITQDANQTYCIGTSFYDGGSTTHYVGATNRRCSYRWASVTIPDGATIGENSYIQINTRFAITDIKTNVYFEDNATPVAPLSAAEMDAKTPTTAFTGWDNIPDADGYTSSPSIKDIIDELMDDYSYSSGAAMQGLHKDDGSTGRIYIETSKNSKGPKLHIVYEEAGGQDYPITSAIDIGIAVAVVRLGTYIRISDIDIGFVVSAFKGRTILSSIALGIATVATRLLTHIRNSAIDIGVAVSASYVTDWLPGWAKRIEFSVNNAVVDDDLEHFGVLVHLSATCGRGAAYDMTPVFDELENDGNRKKIAFTKADGVTEIYAEIEKWDHGNLEAWLWISKADWTVLTASTTPMFIYYDSGHADNDAYVGDTNDVVAENVWDANFVAVHHLADGADNQHTYDSTSGDNDGTKGAAGEPTQISTGKVANAQNFDGGDHIALANETNYDFDKENPFTLEAWIKTSSTATMMVLSKWDNAGDKSGYSLFHYDDGGVIGSKLYAILRKENLKKIRVYGSSVVTDGAWYHVAFTYDGSEAASGALIYVNGSLESMSVSDDTLDVSMLTNIPFNIGRRNSVTQGWDGDIDEARVSATNRSAAWLAATYETSRDNMLDFGEEETVGIAQYIIDAAIALGIAVSSARLATLQRTSSIVLGIAVTIARLATLIRSSAIDMGVVASVVRLGTHIRSSAIDVGIAVSVVKGFILESAITIGQAITATRKAAYIRTPSISLGVAVAASRLTTRIRNSAIAFGISVSAQVVGISEALIFVVSAIRTIAYNRVASIDFGIAVSVSKGRIILSSIVMGIVVSAFKGRTILSSITLGIATTTTRLATFIRDSDITNGFAMSTQRLRTSLRASDITTGIAVTSIRLFKSIRASAIDVGFVVTAFKGRAILSEITVGIATTTTRLVTIIRGAAINVGVVATASRLITFIRNSAINVGVAVTATRLATWIRSSAISVGWVVGAVVDYVSGKIGYVVDAYITLGIAVTTTRQTALVRLASITTGIVAEATRLSALVRNSVVTMGLVVTVIKGFAKLADITVGLAVTVSRLATFSRTSAITTGIAVTVTKGFAILSGITMGIAVSATRLATLARTASIAFGNAVSVLRGATFSRVSSVTTGIGVTSVSVLGRVRTASITLGVAVTASRLATLARASSITMGIAVTVVRLFKAFRLSEITMGIAVTSVAVLGRVRTATIDIGIAVTTTRLATFNRLSSISVGVAVTAIRLFRALRMADVTLGIAITAVRVWRIRHIVIQVITAQYRQINTVTAQYRLVQGITAQCRTISSVISQYRVVKTITAQYRKIKAILS